MRRKRAPKSELNEVIMESIVHPVQRIFKENMLFAIYAKGYTGAGFNKLLLERTGIKMDLTALLYYRTKSGNSMYYFAAVAYLLDIPVTDLFDPNFIARQQE